MDPSTTARLAPSSGDVAALRRQALDGLLSFLSPSDQEAARSTVRRLESCLREQGARNGGTVLVAYGGGKDSSYTLAFVRAVQLLFTRRYGRPFLLRSATNRHAGMPAAVMENIDRAYRALGMHQDPACELLTIDGNRVRPFQVDAPQSEAVAARNRADILMTGHRTAAEARPTFCNACNLSMANAFGLAAAYRDGADLIVTGDSADEQRAYTAWIHRLARQVPRGGDGRERRGFPAVLGALDDVAKAYFRDIHGDDPRGTEPEHGVAFDVPARLRFFSIYGETSYDAGSHWKLLTEHLGFVFDDLAFSFTESDCANPALMAHLRGLKAEHIFGRKYREGLQEYADFALRLMRRKEFPQHLIDVMAERYARPESHELLRARVNSFARDAYGIKEEQLVCMVHSPFTSRGSGLGRYLKGQAPHLVRHQPAIHDLLRHPSADGNAHAPHGRQGLEQELEKLSGLTLAQLRWLYASDMLPSLVLSILKGDPHKAPIRTRHSPDGPEVTETISGR
ncbi:PqqD family protein [Streptomyces sp. WAC 01529]|uniref:PqqD family protein n=1 Tax=Streptomyces sp. WAC 01529 TaxID=2203205 RepID=UPI001F0CA267|nr:PqqD family protein [Streptomyces sp. WAC 01529]